MCRPSRSAPCHPRRPHFARGMCSKCYDKWRYAQNPEKRKQPARRWYSRNKVVAVKRASKWGSSNPDRRAQIMRTYRRKNKPKFANWSHLRRCQKDSGVDCQEKILLLLKERFCRWCCRKLNLRNFSVDHIFPLSKGGLHVPSNLGAACRSCNSSKSNKMLTQWQWTPV